MRKFMKNFHRGEKGFTLIELLIVIVILGILAAVVALNVGGFLGTGTKQAAMIEKDTVQTAVLAGMSDKGVGQITATGAPLTDATTNFDVLLGGTYISTKLTGTIQGGYGVDSTGAVDFAQYPYTDSEYYWTVALGWTDTTQTPPAH